MQRIEASGYFLDRSHGPLRRERFSISTIEPHETVVQVAGCGLCHTDLAFLSGAVASKHSLPLILGHEISGTVVATGSLCKSLLNKNVIVPAVLPCGECVLCREERDNICQNQKMPGNDFHGGFASHVVAPGRSLCELPEDLGPYRLSQLAIIADAVTTPYQAILRSGLRKGELAIVVGVGGIGVFAVQHAKNLGAVVIAIDVDEARLERAKSQGADYVLSSANGSEKTTKDKVRAWAQRENLPSVQWKIFETSGSPEGQSLAFSLLTFAGTLGLIGYTREKVSVRLSNVMAFDADVFGNWGCRPAYYSDVIDKVLENKLRLLENIEEHPLSSINEVISLTLHHKLNRRAILVP